MTNLEVFLEQAGQGCVSGNINEWPQLKPACKYAIEEINKLRQETEKFRKQVMVLELSRECALDLLGDTSGKKFRKSTITLSNNLKNSKKY